MSIYVNFECGNQTIYAGDLDITQTDLYQLPQIYKDGNVDWNYCTELNWEVFYEEVQKAYQDHLDNHNWQKLVEALKLLKWLKQPDETWLLVWD